MKVHLLLSILVVVSLLGRTAAIAQNTEADFHYVSAIPGAAGERIQSADGLDRKDGLEIHLDIFQEALSDVVVETRVTHFRCIGAPAIADKIEPNILAVRLKPLKPRTFAAAGMHDIYIHAYVRDREQRVRFYQNLNAKQMQVLTERFKPLCPKV